MRPDCKMARRPHRQIMRARDCSNVAVVLTLSALDDRQLPHHWREVSGRAAGRLNVCEPGLALGIVLVRWRVPSQTQPLCGTSICLPWLVSRREHPPHAPWRPILNIVRVILAILLPPIGVLLTVGLGLHFWINILLTIFGYIPGIVHAVWIISSRAKERELKDVRYR